MYRLKVENQDPVGALSGFLKKLLAEKIVAALLIPQQLDERITYTFVTRPEGVIAPDPFSPVAYLNAARLAREVSSRDKKTGVLLRACEISALVELVKLNQADLANLLLIGVDCAGTYEPAAFQELTASGAFSLSSWLSETAATGGRDLNGAQLRTACSLCPQPVSPNAQLNLGWLGQSPLEEIVIDSQTELPADKLGLLPAEPSSSREKLLGELTARRSARREEAAREFRQRVNSPRVLRKALAACIRCYNCRAACPVCICPECVFVSPLFQHEPDHYIEQADRRLAAEMPADTLLFHLTRLTHVGLSCVGCGHCESACPSKIPLTLLFTTAGQKIQELFNYVPGRDPQEKLPLAAYKLNELEPR